MASGLPVSSTLLRLEKIAGQPARPPASRASGTSHEYELGQCQLDAVTGRLDVVADEAFRQLAQLRHPFDRPCRGEPARRRPCDDLSSHVHAAVGKSHDEIAADFRLYLEQTTVEILLRQHANGQRLPYLFRRRRNLDHVDRLRLELCRVGHARTSAIVCRFLSSSLQDGASARPVSSKLFMLESTAGQPRQMFSNNLLAGAKSSWTIVSRT